MEQNWSVVRWCLSEDNLEPIYIEKRRSNDNSISCQVNTTDEKIFLPEVSDVILWLLWEKLSLSVSHFLSLPPVRSLARSASLFSPSQTTDPLGYFRERSKTDCLLLISVRCRHFNNLLALKQDKERERAKAREIDLQSATRDREEKEKILS